MPLYTSKLLCDQPSRTRAAEKSENVSFLFADPAQRSSVPRSCVLSPGLPDRLLDPDWAPLGEMLKPQLEQLYRPGFHARRLLQKAGQTCFHDERRGLTVWHTHGAGPDAKGGEVTPRPDRRRGKSYTEDRDTDEEQ